MLRAQQIKQFLRGQDFYYGLRATIGLVLPVILFVSLGHLPEAISLALGANGAATVDKSGSLARRRNLMLVCSGAVFISALLSGLTSENIFLLGLFVSLLGFVCSMLAVYGNQVSPIGFAALFILILTMRSVWTPLEALQNAVIILAGGLWYTGYSLVVSSLQPHLMAQQALAEYFSAISQVLRIRARLYNPGTDLEDTYHELARLQATMNVKQQGARDLILRFARKRHVSPAESQLINVFIHIVDLHERLLSSHADFRLLREQFAATGILQHYASILQHMAHILDVLGMDYLGRRGRLSLASYRHDMLAIQQDLSETEHNLAALGQRMQDGRATEGLRMLARILNHLKIAAHMLEESYQGDGQTDSDRWRRADQELVLADFLSAQDYSWQVFQSNLTFSSPVFRHALRVAIALAIGYWGSVRFGFNHAPWIILTVLVILKPGFSLTRQRNTQRLIGTVIGCLIGGLILALFSSKRILLGFLILGQLIGISLMTVHYLTAVVGFTVFTLIMYHLLLGLKYAIVMDRLLDTFLGSLIAVGVSYLFPYWEYRFIRRTMGNVLQASIGYLETVWPGPEQERPSLAAVKLARKDAQASFANLTASFQRMLVEPKRKQPNVQEINQFLIQCQFLTGYVAGLAVLLQGQAQLGCLRILDPAAEATVQNLRAAATLLTGGNQALTLPVQAARQQTIEDELYGLMHQPPEGGTQPQWGWLVDQLRLILITSREIVVIAQAIHLG